MSTDLSAGCQMADMADLQKVQRTYHELNKALNFDEVITPITYINSAADLKAFCGEHDGIVCSRLMHQKFLSGRFSKRKSIILFDQHLGRWTGFKMGIDLDDMVVWDPDFTPRRINKRTNISS